MRRPVPKVLQRNPTFISQTKTYFTIMHVALTHLLVQFQMLALSFVVNIYSFLSRGKEYTQYFFWGGEGGLLNALDSPVYSNHVYRETPSTSKLPLQTNIHGLGNVLGWSRLPGYVPDLVRHDTCDTQKKHPTKVGSNYFKIPGC